MSETNIAKAILQLSYLYYEITLIVNQRYWRWLTCWIGGGAGVIASYRFDRFFYLLIGENWALLRVLFFPFFWFLRALSSPHEINYKADIGKGLKILHHSLGVVISGYAIVGEGLILTGGNCIGGRTLLKWGELVLGNDVLLGANAVILGPLRLGNNVKIGAGAVVVDSFPDNAVLIGTPAYSLANK